MLVICVLALVAATFGGSSPAGTESARAGVDGGAASGTRPSYVTEPTISGRPEQGQVLTVSPGTWEGTTPISLAYQWERCASTNLATASGFEVDTAGWTPRGTTFTRVTSPVRSGSYSLKVTAPGQSIQEGATYAIVPGTVAGGTRYRFAVHINGAPIDLDMMFRLWYYDSAGYQLIGSGTAKVFALKNRWQKQSISFTPPALTHRIEIQLALSSQGKPAFTFYLDDVRFDSCTVIPNATSTSYTVTFADVGSLMTAVVNATNSVGTGGYAGQTEQTTDVWGVAPAFTGPTYQTEAEAAADEPPPPPPIVTTLPTWRNLYDWPVAGHGYVGWHFATSAVEGAYGNASNLGGNHGLWTWPVGRREYTPNYAEWTYTAPGTTRLSTAEIDLSYRNKLLAHHCIEVGFRTGTTVIHSRNWCKPVHPPDSQRNVHISLVDPQNNPTSKVLFFRVYMPVCNNPDPTPCSKYISQHDPLTTGGYARLKRVDMILVDDDLPEVTWHDRLSIEEERYDVTVAASDAGSGVKRITLEHVGEGQVAASDAPCDPTHNTPALDNRICPERHSLGVSLATSGWASGQHTFVARAEDVAGNVGSATWALTVDRSEPPAPAVTQVDFSTPVSVAAALQWARDHGVTPEELVSQIAAGADTLTLFFTIPDGATDEQMISEPPEGLFTDLAEMGHDVWAYYTPNPLISAMVVSGTPSGTFTALDSLIQARIATLRAPREPGSRAPHVHEPQPPNCPAPWWPDEGRITTKQSSIVLLKWAPQLKARFVHQLFSWSSENLGRFKCASDVTYEPDAIYYKPDGTYLGDEAGWMAATNLPESYLDTRFRDPSCCAIYTIGTDDVDKLRARPQHYYTLIRTFEGPTIRDLGSPFAQAGYHRFHNCPQFVVKWCVFERKGGGVHLLDLNANILYEHVVPGPDGWVRR